MNTGNKIRTSLMVGVSISFLASHVFAAEWRIVDISGPVRVAIPGSAPSEGRQNQTVPTGTSVTTAGGGRATLDNGEQRIVGSKYGSSNPPVDVPALVDLYAAGRLPLERLVSGRWPISEVDAAYDALRGGHVTRGLLLMDQP